jgi:hypothetical protein
MGRGRGGGGGRSGGGRSGGGRRNDDNGIGKSCSDLRSYVVLQRRTLCV